MKNAGATENRILIVEDGPEICQVCFSVLMREGLSVDIATNGRVAQDMIEAKPYDLCLIDIRMPKMSGNEFYQWLQKKYSQLSRQVIFTSGDLMGGDTKNFLEQAAKLFLPKPFTPKELKRTVQEALKTIGK